MVVAPKAANGMPNLNNTGTIRTFLPKNSR
jgi:hypothetical protein